MEDPIGNVSSHMLLYMVRGMFSALKFLYAHFATNICDWVISLITIVLRDMTQFQCLYKKSSLSVWITKVPDKSGYIIIQINSPKLVNIC